MGNNESRTREVDQFLKEFKFVQAYKDSRLGEVSIYKGYRGEFILVKEGWAENKEEFDSISRNIMLR